MKIVLVENSGEGTQPIERTFQKDVIRIGRDANSCDIVFENKQYPMVSRQHAEIRCQNGFWLLRDANSSFGTYINGQKISQQTAQVNIGSSLQFGTDGPVLHVIYLDAEKNASTDVPPPKPIQQNN